MPLRLSHQQGSGHNYQLDRLKCMWLEMVRTGVAQTRGKESRPG